MPGPWLLDGLAGDRLDRRSPRRPRRDRRGDATPSSTSWSRTLLAADLAVRLGLRRRSHRPRRVRARAALAPARRCARGVVGHLARLAERTDGRRHLALAAARPGSAPRLPRPRPRAWGRRRDRLPRRRRRRARRRRAPRPRRSAGCCAHDSGDPAGRFPYGLQPRPDNPRPPARRLVLRRPGGRRRPGPRRPGARRAGLDRSRPGSSRATSPGASRRRSTSPSATGPSAARTCSTGWRRRPAAKSSPRPRARLVPRDAGAAGAGQRNRRLPERARSR